mgnify:CR=1 FL=1
MAATFAVGDRVRIRYWDDMASEFGVDEDGKIPCKYVFTQAMRVFCGQEYTISTTWNNHDGTQRLYFEDAEDDEDAFAWSSDMCEHILSSPNVFVESIGDFV